MIESIIPARLVKSVNLDSLDKLNALNQTSNRAILMLRYICEKQLPNVHNLYGDVSTDQADRALDTDGTFANKVNYLKLMINLSVKMVFFVDYVQRIIFCMSNMSVGQYNQVTDEQFAPTHYKKLDDINQEMARIIERLKNENLSLKFDLSVLDGHIRKI